ncbi:hypothetical protein C8R43DRAFT_982450 [Mycena crocata]|nr:hypothetical protein C8R43DRAFT_982450 [Mycena crocata]
MSLAALPEQLQYELLSYLPDFSALISLVSTSRCFYAVFSTHRDLVLKAVTENFIGLPLCEVPTGDFVNSGLETANSSVSRTIKFLMRDLEALEPIVFRLLIHQDAHWDEPDRCPSASESARLRRAAYRFSTFCALSSAHQQSNLLAQLATIEVFELVHLVDGLRKMVSVLEDDDPDDEGRISRIVSTGPGHIWRLWNLRREGPAFRETMAAAAAGTDDGAFDDALHHFEVTRNLSAFDVARTRALLDVGHQQTAEALVQLETLMEPPTPLSPPPKPRRPRFRSLKLPLCDNSDKKSARLSFLPDHLNSLPIQSDIPYFMLILNGEPRIMPLNPHQLAELTNPRQLAALANTVHL